MEHTEWFNVLTSNASGLEASRRAGITTSTLNRQLSRNALSAESVIHLARAYGANPTEALAATGYLTSEEVVGASPEALAELLSDRALIRAVARRIDADPAAWFGTFGELADEDPDANVHQLHPADTPGVHDLKYVADSSPDEPEEGDDDYHDGP
ncbi:hypothetical protein [Corynebacterium doosanense]|uniref:DNA-binding protein n=1 Tax=Corynebacterium doosanense CAU 212 = DSM 45436 TaxID=558173 RepID=A0A097IDD3_9CORY|nr:hypothetical protein [Corynebacterium doosanense]AIT60153.1 hypothetical protein CDOO_01815 [Corynebacterium doosanense CAU 212 = DSM 45436]